VQAVSKTSILTLRARADEHARADRAFADPVAAEWFTRVAWPIELDAWYGPAAQIALALRADDIDQILRRYARSTPLSGVVELGCGFSTRQSRLADLSIDRWLDVDLEDVVRLRRSLGASGEQVAASVLDDVWMDRVSGDPSGQIFIAEGLLYYLPRREVDRLFDTLTRRFPGAAIIMDVLGANDHATLLRNTAAVGTPVAWRYEGDFKDVLAGFGLASVPGFEPDRLLEDALKRYWARFDDKMRGAIYWAMNNEMSMRSRSGTVLGRLRSVP
jgi:O-methyltransferase involved in polyketide biosynthesis